MRCDLKSFWIDKKHVQRNCKHRKDCSEEYQGQVAFPPTTQVLGFLWSMANQEPNRIVADRFNITMNSVDRVLHKGTLSEEYI